VAPHLCDHPEAHERTVAIVEAYTILDDPERRAEYDRGPSSVTDVFREWLDKKMQSGR